MYCPVTLFSNIVLCVLLPLSGNISESLVQVTVVTGPPVEIQVNTESIILKFDMVTPPRVKKCVVYFCLETGLGYYYQFGIKLLANMYHVLELYNVQ